MTTALRLHYTLAEYVRFEASAHEKHEFVGGLILAMAGGPLEHARLASQVIISLGAQLVGRRCSVYDSNARVLVAATGNAYYPDASVVCGSLETAPADSLSLVNPTVLVEVLSPSTAEYDRTDKLADYQQLESLKHVVHVAHDERRIDVWSRERDAWVVASYRDGESAVLGEIACAIDVRALYRDPRAG